MLFLAVWWCWIDTAWCTNWLDPRHTPVRLMLFALMPGASADAGPSYTQVGASPAVAVSLLRASLSPFCGGGWEGDLSHGPCHACRNGAPVLPPSPCVAEPAFASVAPVEYTRLAEPVPPPARAPRPPSQGPPAA